MTRHSDRPKPPKAGERRQFQVLQAFHIAVTNVSEQAFENASSDMLGWRRLGVVLSVFWFVGFGFWLGQEDHDSAWTASGYRTCSVVAGARREIWIDFDRTDPQVNENLEKIDRWQRQCEDIASAEYLRKATPMWGILAADALSLALLWLAAWAIVAVWCWVAAAFRQQA